VKINHLLFLNTVTPKITAINQNAIKIKKIIFAMEAAPLAMPVNPKIPAIIAIIKNITVHLSITKSL
jgi:hypothetical protein